MNRKQLNIVALVSGLVVCSVFILFFRDRLDRLPVILIAAALALAVYEGIRFFGRKMI